MNNYDNWLYTKLTIPNLDAIQQELATQFWQVYTNPKPASLIGVDMQPEIRADLPNLTSWLEQFPKFATRWTMAYWSVVEDQSSNIHIDFTEPSRCMAINFPVINCEHSYMVWYDAPIAKQMQADDRGHGIHDVIFPGDDHASCTGSYGEGDSSFWCSEIDAVEIERLHWDGPAVVNTSVPHKAECANPGLRALFSLRLYPWDFPSDLDEIVKNHSTCVDVL